MVSDCLLICNHRLIILRLEHCVILGIQQYFDFKVLDSSQFNWVESMLQFAIHRSVDLTDRSRTAWNRLDSDSVRLIFSVLSRMLACDLVRLKLSGSNRGTFDWTNRVIASKRRFESTGNRFDVFSAEDSKFIPWGSKRKCKRIDSVESFNSFLLKLIL